MDAEILSAIRKHAQDDYPKECCGLILIEPNNRFSVVRCVNQYPDLPPDEISSEKPVKCARNSFLISVTDRINAEKRGKIVAVYHSHPDGQAQFTPEDIVASEETGYPYIVTEFPSAGWASYAPKGFSTNLVGRPFIYGVYDCFTLVRDYYLHTHKIAFDPVAYKDYGWWALKENVSFYKDGFLKLGFKVATELKPGTIILMQYKAKTPNHVAVYTGDGYMLHHLSDRISEIAIYGGAWEHNTVALLRHESL